MMAHNLYDTNEVNVVADGILDAAAGPMILNVLSEGAATGAPDGTWTVRDAVTAGSAKDYVDAIRLKTTIS